MNDDPNVWVGQDGENQSHAGFRFPNVTIPQGAPILSASIALYKDSDVFEACTLRIYGNDADNATAPATAAQADSLALTGEYLDWAIPDGNSGSPYTTPDLTVIVQEIVDRPGWASGNAMQFLLKSIAQTSHRVFRTYDFTGSTWDPVVTITFLNGTAINFGSVPISLSLSASFTLEAGGYLNQTLPALEGTGTIISRNAFVIETLPALEIFASGQVGNVANLNQILPALDLEAYGGGRLEAILPALELSGHIITGISGSLNQILPLFEISAHGFAAQGGSVVAVLPCLEISAHGFGTVVGRLSAILPALTLRASGVSGSVGSAVLILPALAIEATGIMEVLGNLNQILPAIEINAHGRIVPAIVTYKIVVLNPKGLTVSEYAAFDFNSFALFNGKYLGATPVGIHVLEGEKDNGKNIDAILCLGQIPISGGKPRDIWVMGRSEGPMIVTMSEDEDPAEEGRIEYLIASLGQDRAKVPRGMDPTYFQVGLKNAQGCAFDLDSIQVFGESVRRKKA